MHLLNAGCGTWYAEGWVNTDTWSTDTTRPDIKVEPNEPYPFPDSHFDAIYLGHILEHMPWEKVSPFLLDMKRIAKPDAHILVVGPDVYRSITLWAKGEQPWHMVISTLEHQDTHYQPGREEEIWEEAPHYWNCHEERLIGILRKLHFADVGSCTDEIPNDPGGRSWHDVKTGITWPVVGKHTWQCAVRCRNSKV